MNKGITLITLIITIIVLLLLAGITITIVAGENGLLYKATKAEEATKKANALSKLEIIISETNAITHAEENRKATLDDLKIALEKDKINFSVDGEFLIVNVDGYYFKVNQELRIIDSNEGNEEDNNDKEDDKSKIAFVNFDNGYNPEVIKNSVTQQMPTKNGNSNIKITTENYKVGEASCYFPGTAGTRLTENVSNLNLGTSDFTVQFWSYAEEQTMPYALFFGSDLNTNLTLFIQDGAANGNISLAIGNTRIIDTNKKYIKNEWVHYAVVRKDGVFTIYENGKNIGSTSSYIGNTVNMSDFAIGGNISTGNTSYKGYIDDFSIFNSARYVGDFIPPQDAQNTATNVYYDFDGYLKGFLDVISNKNLLLQGDGNIYVSEEHHKAGKGSCYFPGTAGGRLTFGNRSNLNFGTNDFTVQFWSYAEEQTMQYALFFGNDLNDNLNLFATDKEVQGNISLALGRSRIINTNKKYVKNGWVHYAVVRKDGVFTIYENGKNIGTDEEHKDYLIDLSNLSIGGNNATNDTSYKGYIDEFEIYNKALYDSEFTQ